MLKASSNLKKRWSETVGWGWQTTCGPDPGAPSATAAEDLRSEGAWSYRSEAMPRRDEHFGSQCLTLICRLLTSSSRQARWDSDNTFLFGSSGGARLGESVESTFSFPTKCPWRAAYAPRPSSSSLLLFAAFRQRSIISIAPLPSPPRCQTALLSAPLHTFPKFSVTLSLSFSFWAVSYSLRAIFRM